MELWFDFSCPYAYLASQRAGSLGVEIDWRPMLLGGVFRGSGAGDGPMATLSPQKAAHNLADMHRWGRHFGVPFAMPPAHPMRTVRALRALLALPREAWPEAIAAIYAAYWQRGEDITSDAVLGKLLPPEALAGADDQKDELRRRTDEAVGHGIFGAPAWRWNGKLVWGQDRLAWIAAMLAGWDPDRDQRGARIAPSSGKSLEAFFDVSSPFAYLGLTQVAGHATRLVPILLGGLFRAIGQQDVPLLAMPAAKQRYVGLDMERWARWWGVPFAFPKKFPQRTITAQRLCTLPETLDAQLAIAIALGKAMWAEGRDLEDETVLRQLVDSVGMPADSLARAKEAKQQLIANTEEAQRRGVFGVPTWIVGGDDLYWGQDRLELATLAR